MRFVVALLAAALVFAAAPLNESYKTTADQLIDAALADNGAYQKLSYLCDRIGNRLSGSKALEEAIRWAAAEMKKDGLVNVTAPPVTVPHWLRGQERLTMLAPASRELVVLGLGGSIGTTKQGIQAEVVPVATFDELERL